MSTFRAKIEKDKIKNTFSSIFKGAEIEDVAILKGDASTRSYVRLKVKNFKKASLIGMVLGNPEKAIVPEEFVEEIENFDELPFLNIQGYLKKAGVRVPEIYGYNLKEGVLFLEDFGDDIVENIVKNSADFPVELYLDAIGQLVKVQKYSIEEPDDSVYAFRLKFSEGVFFWEFEHFIEFCIEKNSSLNKSFKEIQDLKETFKELSKILSRTSRVFVHRDFHSRNLLKLGSDRVGVIDFQDAVTGPIFYDLVSLLRDSYVDVPEEIEKEIMEYYKSSVDFMSEDEKKNFNYFYELSSLQRNLKAAGRFVYINDVKGNPSFLPYVKPTLKKAAKACSRLIDYEKRLMNLYNILERMI